MNKDIREYDLFDITEMMQKSGDKWAKEKQILDHKERFAKVLFSQEFLKLRELWPKESISVLEKRVYASAQWEDYLNEWKIAEESALKARIKYEAYENLFTAKQDQLATERAVKKLL